MITSNFYCPLPSQTFIFNGHSKGKVQFILGIIIQKLILLDIKIAEIIFIGQSKHNFSLRFYRKILFFIGLLMIFHNILAIRNRSVLLIYLACSSLTLKCISLQREFGSLLNIKIAEIIFIGQSKHNFYLRFYRKIIVFIGLLMIFHNILAIRNRSFKPIIFIKSIISS